ncbi:MAG: hypothetical protein IKK40_04700 [Bacteroidales bacterium]|nr:hypothetical protein [Bacteroidales bacterium]MBR6265933.1 hypothetical protein [Bacteroidales bacterium]
MNDKYKDIINLPHPESKRFPRMSLLNRAVQFSPFAALSGHHDAIHDTILSAEEKIENQNMVDEEDEIDII